MIGAQVYSPPNIGNVAVSSLWNQPEYSDIAIKFSGRSIFCHKVVLCRASDYFKSWLIKSRESGVNEVELKDDDPDALEALLSHIYLRDYDMGSTQPWRFYLALAIVAQKHLLPDLADIAVVRFRVAALDIEDMSELVLILRALDVDYE
ncbi:hypothetical protein LTR95_016732 [Oleoguttula sp. CCFEE 5521]